MLSILPYCPEIAETDQVKPHLEGAGQILAGDSVAEVHRRATDITPEGLYIAAPGSAAIGGKGKVKAIRSGVGLFHEDTHWSQETLTVPPA